MDPILVTVDVLKLDKSNEFNEEQLSNMFFIVLTNDELKLAKFISIISLQ